MTELAIPVLLDNEHPHIKIVLIWNGNVDFDLSAFMLGENGYIKDDADLVFYNSLNRDSPFDVSGYADENDWIAATLPVSSDGSLIGSKDSVGSVAGRSQEVMALDMSKVSDEIVKIVFCVSIFQEKKQLTSPSLANKCDLRIEEDNNLLTEYAISLDNNVKAVEVFEMTRLDQRRWSGRKIHIAYASGLQEIIDKYV